MSERTWDRGLLLTAAVVAFVTAVSVGLAWHTSSDFPRRISLLALAPILSAAAVSYTLRMVRFHYFLTRSGVPITLRSTAVVQVIGFALSVTPGHIGEVFKLHLIRQRTGTPMAQTAPLLLLDRLTEGGGFFILASVSGLALPPLRARVPVPSLLLIALAGMFAFALIQQRWKHGIAIEGMRVVESSPLGRLLPHALNLWRGLKSGFTAAQILGGLALSVVARFADGLVLLFAARILGVDLMLPTAVFILAVSGLTGGISFLPAGIGAVETTMVGLLVLSGATWTNGLAIALLVRVFILWLWVTLGLGLAVVLRFITPRTNGQPSGDLEGTYGGR